jgi:hypothetical protein
MGRTSREKQVSRREPITRDIKDVIDFRELNFITDAASTSEILIRTVPGNVIGKVNLADLFAAIDANEDGLDDVTLVTTFETINQNLKAYPATFTYDITGKFIQTVTYDVGSGLTIVKTFTYSGNDLISIELSGTIPSGIATKKTLTYSGKNVSSITYT